MGDFWYDKKLELDLSEFSSKSSGIDSFFREGDRDVGPEGEDSTPLDSRIASSDSAGEARVKVAHPDELEGFVRLAETDTLIRMSEKDLWELEEDEDGEYTIQRLYDDGEPLKV
jgi:hypothetical protein